MCWGALWAMSWGQVPGAEVREQGSGKRGEQREQGSEKGGKKRQVLLRRQTDLREKAVEVMGGLERKAHCRRCSLAGAISALGATLCLCTRAVVTASGPARSLHLPAQLDLPSDLHFKLMHSAINKKKERKPDQKKKTTKP